jgi:hypothetical protein
LFSYVPKHSLAQLLLLSSFCCRHGLTLIALLLEFCVALPIGTKTINVRIWRYWKALAPCPDSAKTAIALPPVAENIDAGI